MASFSTAASKPKNDLISRLASCSKQVQSGLSGWTCKPENKHTHTHTHTRSQNLSKIRAECSHTRIEFSAWNLRTLLQPDSRLHHLLPPLRSQCHKYNLRNNSDYDLPKCRTDRFKKSFFPAMAFKLPDANWLSQSRKHEPQVVRKS